MLMLCVYPNIKQKQVMFTQSYCKLKSDTISEKLCLEKILLELYNYRFQFVLEPFLSHFYSFGLNHA